MLLNRVADRLLDFCFPRQCPGCGAAHERAGLFCPGCERAVQALETAPACRQCGRPVTVPDAPCPLCKGRGLRPFARTVRLSLYRQPVQGVISQLKYRGRWHLAEALADRLVDAQDLASWLSETDALVPVPLYPRRQVERGYNQADVIARRIGIRCGVPVVEAAARIRDTPTQTGLHALSRRADNLRGAFAVTAAAVRGRRLAVVDDVSTTGATLASLGRVLMAAGAAEVSAVVLCVADPRGRDFAYA